MTLVVFVRCQDGCILASDRKASSIIGNREESKIKHNNAGWAIAAAGDDASAIMALFSALDGNTVTPSNIKNLVVNTLGTYNRTSSIRVNCIVLTALDEGVTADRVETIEFGDVRAASENITSNFECIGEAAPVAVAQHYLKNCDYGQVACDNAVPEVLAILKQASKEGNAVGSQQDFGFDVVALRTHDCAQLIRVTDEWAVASIQFSEVTGERPHFDFHDYENGAV
ncbi:MAG: hypothetical protein ABSA92_05365 [Candidatus Bathyarchaeia archaeon]|jgi:20S proteasome alpha/beta subunit